MFRLFIRIQFNLFEQGTHYSRSSKNNVGEKKALRTYSYRMKVPTPAFKQDKNEDSLF